MTDRTLNFQSGDSSSSKTVYRASWVCPVDQPPIENGFVEVNKEGSDRRTISNVGTFANYNGPSESVVDLGDGAIIPGLINAHTHLEFSDLPRPLGRPGIRFTDWIRLIVESRHASNQDSPAKKAEAIKQGIAQSVKSGVVAIGEICTAPFVLNDYVSDAPVSMLHFLEQLGSDQAVLADKRSELTEHLSANQRDSNGQVQSTFGASPHAPYSCHSNLVQQICQIAANQNSIVAMHLAETKEERELLDSSSGDFVELLKNFGVWNPENFGPQRSILSTLQTLSACDALIIHGNYLDDVELDFIAQHRDRMKIVFCPRTHDFFRHDQYPIKKIVQRGIGLSLGTDSLASNPDLRMFEELKQVAKTFPQLATQQILEMGTINGASAMGLESKLGTLTVGKSAAIGFVEQNELDPAKQVDQWLLATTSTCRRIEI